MYLGLLWLPALHQRLQFTLVMTHLRWGLVQYGVFFSVCFTLSTRSLPFAASQRVSSHAFIVLPAEFHCDLLPVNLVLVTGIFSIVQTELVTVPLSLMGLHCLLNTSAPS